MCDSVGQIDREIQEKVNEQIGVINLSACKCATKHHLSREMERNLRRWAGRQEEATENITAKEKKRKGNESWWTRDFKRDKTKHREEETEVHFERHREETILSKTVRLTEQSSLLFEKNTDEFGAAVPSFLMLLLCAVIVSTAAIICYYGEWNQPILAWVLPLVDCCSVLLTVWTATARTTYMLSCHCSDTNGWRLHLHRQNHLATRHKWSISVCRRATLILL